MRNGWLVIDKQTGMLLCRFNQEELIEAVGEGHFTATQYGSAIVSLVTGEDVECENAIMGDVILRPVSEGE